MSMTPEQAAKKDIEYYWQIQKRQQWKYEFTEKTLVRYTEEAHLSEEICQGLMDYLTSDACVATLRLNNKPVENAAKWKPVAAWYDTDSQNLKDDTKLTRVRLYHALVLDPDNDGKDGPYAIENGCRYKVSWTFYWKTATAPKVPDSTSGVSYKIGGLTRDEETGRFTYYIEKRERVQQDVARHHVVNPATGEQIDEEQHLGVNAANLAKYSALNDTVAADGTLIKVLVSKNEDCTFDVQIEYRKQITGTAEETCAKTQFEHEHGTTKTGQDVPAEGARDVDEAKDGVTHSRRIAIEPGGKAEIKETTTTELPVAGAQQTTEQDAFSKQESVLDRNQPAADTAAVVADKGVTVMKRVEATAGKFWNNFKQTVTELAYAAARVVTQTDAFGTHTVTTNRNQDDAAAAPEGVVGGTKGDVIQITDEITPGKKHNQTIDHQKETPVTAARAGKTETAFETVEEQTDRSQAAPDTAAAVGQEKSTALTPGGLNDNTVRTTTEKDVPHAGEAHEKDLYKTRDETTARGQTAPAAAADATTGGTGGKIIEVRSQMTPTGKHAVTTAITQERKVESAQTVDTADLFSKLTTIINANDLVTSVPSVGAFAVGKIATLRTEKTPGGLVTITQTTETAGEEVDETISWSDSLSNYSFEFFHNKKTKPSVTGSETLRITISVQCQKNRFGYYDGAIYRRQAKYDTTKTQWWTVASDWTKTGQQRTEEQLVTIDGKTYERKFTYTFDEGYCTDIEDAYTKVYSVTAPQSATAPKKGSYVHPYASGAFWRRVTDISVSQTSELPLAGSSVEL